LNPGIEVSEFPDHIRKGAAGFYDVKGLHGLSFLQREKWRAGWLLVSAGILAFLIRNSHFFVKLPFFRQRFLKDLTPCPPPFSLAPEKPLTPRKKGSLWPLDKKFYSDE
jgi:hypothetical protein